MIKICGIIRYYINFRANLDLMKGVKEAVDNEGLLGLFMGGFKAGAVGCSGALIFGYIASLLSSPKMRK